MRVQIRAKALEQAMQLVGFEPLTASVLQMQSPEQLEKTGRAWALHLRVLLVLARHELELAA